MNKTFMKSSAKIYITYEKMRCIAFGYLALPLVLFLVFFVRLYISIPVTVIVIFSYIWAIGKQRNVRQPYQKTEKTNGVQISLWMLIIIGIICLIWCYLGGQGGFFYQTSDWYARNAVFRDLINFSWPPYYDVIDSVLCYYVGHWLPAAAAGKLIFLITQNVELTWTMANILLGIWTALGCYISMLLLIVYMRPKKTGFIIMAVLLMIFFSGLDIVGWLKNGYAFADILNSQHIEWWQWYPHFQFSSNTTCLYWVFNQSTAAWVGTLCFLNEKSTRNYGFIITCCMISSIMPSIGMVFIMMGMMIFMIFRSIRDNSFIKYLKGIFSIQNIFMVLSVVPILFFYYTMNTTLNNNEPLTIIDIPYKRIALLCAAAVVSITFIIIMYKHCSQKMIENKFGWLIGIVCVLISYVINGLLRSKMDWDFFWFLLLEAGIYFIIVFPNYYRDNLYYITACSLIIIPAIQVGTNSDFCMRASIPALIIIMSLCGKKLVDDLEERSVSTLKLITSVLLVTILVVGMVTPIVEIWRGIYNCVENGTVMLADNSWTTLNRYADNGGIAINFVSLDYRGSFFYNHLMR